MATAPTTNLAPNTPSGRDGTGDWMIFLCNARWLAHQHRFLFPWTGRRMGLGLASPPSSVETEREKGHGDARASYAWPWPCTARPGDLVVSPPPCCGTCFVRRTSFFFFSSWRVPMAPAACLTTVVIARIYSSMCGYPRGGAWLRASERYLALLLRVSHIVWPRDGAKTDGGHTDT
jgi:hypothetical protein